MLLRSGRRLATLEEAARATVPRCRTRARSDLFAGLPEEILLDILLRLPPKSVLRCRAVCRLWRRIASDPAFLLDHHRRQPELPLMNCGGRLRALHRQARRIHPVFRFPEAFPFGFTADASCDGLLISGQHICNPTTRQWAPLSPNPKHGVENILGLYRHQPSGEYRVLYWRYPNNLYNMDCLIEYRVLAVGTDDPRIIDCSATPVETELISRGGPAIYGAAVLLNANLHLHWRKSFGVPYHRILVFDTVAETFRHMRPPAVNPRHVMHLFDMGGTLAASTSKDGMTGMSIFMLQDHDVWAFRYRITLPVVDIRRFQERGDWWAKVVNKEGDVLVTCYEHLLLFDKVGNLIGNSKFDDDLPVVLPFRLKESLVQHTFFQKTEN
ncbi:F-box protein At3g07870 [Lolium perenne]|uniref:F-box protein At3g07870 n=1 Tax=Lolium perenne TaxID=4522 RepID=UPI0021EAFC7E|nr:F-box protein At3g07870-like [Lolium perenne]